MITFINFLSQFVLLPNNEISLLESVLTFKTYKVGDKIQQEGRVCHSIMFILSGKARSYFINHEGQEFTWNFHFNDADSKFENYFLVDYHSFLRQTPSHLTIEALEDIEAITLSYTNIQKIVSKSINLEKVASIMSATAYQNVHKRAFSLLTSNAKERYLQLFKRRALSTQQVSTLFDSLLSRCSSAKSKQIEKRDK